MPNPVFNFPIKELEAYIKPCWPILLSSSTSSLISPSIDSRMIALDDKQVLAIYIKGAKAKNRFQEPESGRISFK